MFRSQVHLFGAAGFQQVTLVPPRYQPSKGEMVSWPSHKGHTLVEMGVSENCRGLHRCK